MQQNLSYVYQEICMSATEARYPNNQRQAVLAFESSVEIGAKVLLNTQRLQQKSTHSHNTLLGCVILVLQSVEQSEHDEIMDPLSIDDERPESLVALSDFPKEHDDLWRKSSIGLPAGKIRALLMERLVENPCHAVDDELKVLWPMESAKEMAVIVLGSRAVLLGDWVQQEH